MSDRTIVDTVDVDCNDYPLHLHRRVYHCYGTTLIEMYWMAKLATDKLDGSDTGIALETERMAQGIKRVIFKTAMEMSGLDKALRKLETAIGGVGFPHNCGVVPQPHHNETLTLALGEVLSTISAIRRSWR